MAKGRGSGSGAASETAAQSRDKTWGFAGPVARAYEFAQDDLAICVGPTGGGKTTVSARRCLRAALNQHPSPRDGVRRARIYVVAPTYRIAWDSVIPSYLKEMNRPWGKFTGAKGDPADHLISTTVPNFGRIEVDVRFRAVQDMDLDEFFRGKECTAFWLPEVDTLSPDVLDYCFNRIGRFPEPDDRPDNPAAPAYRGVWGDANAPIIGSWFHERFYVSPRPGEKLFRQPPGYDPDTPDGFHLLAENRDNLAKIDPCYYRTMAARSSPWQVRRLLQCKPTYGRMGEPVHPNFDETVHVSSTRLEPDPLLPVIIGADCGLTPAAAFLQVDVQQNWRQLAEIAVLQGQMDLIEFARAIRQIMATRFARCSEATIILDPAGQARSALNHRQSYANILQAEAGIQVRPAWTNKPDLRRSALRQALSRRGGFLMDPSCVVSAQALNGGWAYLKVRGEPRERADKGRFSHIGEAIEYGHMAGSGLGHAGVVTHRIGGASAALPRVVFD